tara:strand:+ start:480 stop:884 length:405 start_codon:yes stop_codon:yes gene_type:complete
MGFLRNNSFMFLSIVLLLVILVAIFNDPKNKYLKLLEGKRNKSNGQKYLKKAIAQNQKGLSKVIKNLDSTSDVKDQLQVIRNMTDLDTTLNAALKQVGGSSLSSSNLFRSNDSDDSDDSDNDSDDNNNDGSSWF